MTSKLELFNKALSNVGSGRLLALTDDRNERYELDAVYDGCLVYMLERAGWKFALRSSELTYDPAIDTSFGLTYAYTLPTDFVRIAAISTDEMFNSELMDYRKEAGLIYTNSSIIYLSYVSDGASYGLDLAKYSETYAEALGMWMAYRSVLPISKDRGDRADLLRLFKSTLEDAKRSDAIDERVKWKPEGRWAQARRGGRGRVYTKNGRMSW
jgi:hypothetical protein